MKILMNTNYTRILAISLLCFFSQLATAGRGYWEGNIVIQDYYDPINTHYLDMVTGAHVDKMEQRYKKGQFDWVWSDLEYTLKRVPNHPRALLKLVTFSREYKKITPAVADDYFQKAIKFNPDEPNTRVIYGFHLQKYPQLDKAIEQYEIALKLKPNHAQGHYNLALALIDKGELEKAKKHAKEAYNLGYPLEGAKERLIELNAWDNNKKHSTDQ